MAKFDPIDAQAVLKIKSNIPKLETTIWECGVEVSNIVLVATARNARKICKVHAKPYPPKRRRIPGTMRRSIRVIDATTRHPGKIKMDTWLFDWIDNLSKAQYARFEAKRKAGIKAGSRVNKKGTRGGLKRFKKFTRKDVDPRYILGYPLEQQINFIKSDTRLKKAALKAVSRAAIKEQ